jgi:V/A-type H+-transporting ATPase subunit K
MGFFWGILGAAVAVSLAGIGSILGVAHAGRAGAGVLAEDPEKFGSILVLQVLPGTQGIYGFLTAFWVMLKMGLVTGELPLISEAVGLELFAACLPIALAGLFSGYLQGKVSTAGIHMLTKQPGELGKALILSVMVETYAVLGLLVTILLVNGIQL